MSDSEEENEFGDDSSEDAPMSSLRNGGSDEEKTPNKRRRSQVNYAEDDEENDDNDNDDNDDDDEEGNNEEQDDEDDDDDDDVPLSALAAPSPKKKKTTTTSKASNGKKKKDETPTKKKVTKKKTTSSSGSISSATKTNTNGSSDYKSASAALYGSDCDKGLLIQRLLCRWWYAMEWPDPAAIPANPPKHYDPLDGFPGVYVCTEGDDVGAIKDFRDKSTCPNFNNMAKKTSEELQKLLVKALTEQRRQLTEAEGTGTETLKELDDLLKWANKVKPAAAEKAAEKVLKTAKLSLE